MNKASVSMDEFYLEYEINIKNQDINEISNTTNMGVHNNFWTEVGKFFFVIKACPMEWLHKP